jgi:hypothetical protein
MPSASLVRTRRTVLAATTAVVALLTLSGCFKADAHLTVHEDDTIDGVFTIALSKELLSMTGMTFEQVVGEDKPLGDVAIASQEPYDDGTYQGMTYTAARSPIAAFNDENATLTHTGGKFVYSSVMSFSDPDAAAPDPAVPMTGSVKIAMTFPGKVESANGTIDDETNTVTWTGDGTAPLEMEAVAADHADAFPVVLVAAGGGVLLLVAVVVVLLVVRARRRDDAPVLPPTWQVGPHTGPTSWTPVVSSHSGWTPSGPAAPQPPAGHVAGQGPYAGR